MKNFLLIVCSSLLSANCFAQAGMWTWMKGDSTDNASGSFGVQGIPSPSNNPPGLYEPAEWKDKNGNFWFYGGFNYTIGGCSDNIFKYDLQSNQWTWMKGSGTNTTSPVFGTAGVFAPGNTPGNQQWCAASWVDTSGNFWLFGGSNGSGSHSNLLWKYDPAINQWARIRGSTVNNSPGSYGTLGVPSPTNDPPSRWETSASWTDNENNLWLFGGMDPNYVNDLWKYDITTNEWTWMSGSNTSNQFAVYGTKGIPDPANIPGARHCYTKWKDQSGNLWLFGGTGNNANQTGSLNDLWRYDISTNEWTWMCGTASVTDNGLNGPLCELSVNYRPSCRYETRSCWTDANGNFWLFGGLASVEMNDLWIYVPDSNAMALVSSSIYSQGFYGTQGTFSPLTHPPGKMGSLAWTDDAANLWLFSGGFVSGSILRNDLWKYSIDPNCPLIASLPAPEFNASDTDLCQKFCTDFFDQSTNNPTSWQWSFPGGTPSSSNDQNPTNICYNNPGIYDVTLITTNSNGSDTLTLSNYITVYSTPAFPTITQNGYTLTSSPAASYQWQLNSADIPGATNQSYTITQTGYYTVIVGDSNGCVNSATQYVLIDGINESEDESEIAIYPNPSKGDFIIEWLDGFMAGEISIDVVNTLGQKIFSSTENNSSAPFKKEIDLKNISAGIYFLEIKSENIFLKKKIIISK